MGTLELHGSHHSKAAVQKPGVVPVQRPTAPWSWTYARTCIRYVYVASILNVFAQKIIAWWRVPVSESTRF